jgi:hypothetical protein
MTDVTEKTNDYAVRTTTNIAPDRIADVITAGVEGGISYWATDFLLTKEPSEMTLADGETKGSYAPPEGDPWYCDPKLYAADDFIIAVNETEPSDGKGTMKHIIMRKDIEQALQIMADKYPWHFANIVGENDDSETGDVLIQLAVFKEIVYG